VTLLGAFCRDSENPTVISRPVVTRTPSRTRDALAAKKARGFTLGTPANLTDEAKLKGLVARQANAQTNVSNRQAAQLAALLRANGANLRAIAQQLNQSGYSTRRGKAFHPMSVQRLLAGQTVPQTATSGVLHPT